MAEHERSTGQSSEWRTPPAYFDRIGLEFDLDPCWPLARPCFVPARARYTAADDGLRRPWPPGALTFVNPPFGGRRGQEPWLEKFLAHPGGGIALCAARTSADWFHRTVVPRAELLLFPSSKTKFIRPDGSIGKEPGTGVALIGMGRVACEALLHSGLGACMTIVAPRNAAADFASINACHALPHERPHEHEAP